MDSHKELTEMIEQLWEEANQPPPRTAIALQVLALSDDDWEAWVVGELEDFRDGMEEGERDGR